MSTVIPADVRLAAKRGFIRTTTQAYAATLTTGVSASAVLAVVSGEVQLVPTLVTLAIAVASPLLAGAASAASIVSKGIPEEYATAAAPAPLAAGDLDAARASAAEISATPLVTDAHAAQIAELRKINQSLSGATTKRVGKVADAVDLTTLTRAELVDRLPAGVTPGKKTKAQLIEIINAKREA